jgi:cell division protein FtsX
MGHDFVYWALMIATAGAFAAVIAALSWLFYNAKVKKTGEK